MVRDDGLTDRKAHAEAVVLGAVKGIEYLFHVLGGIPGP